MPASCARCADMVLIGAGQRRLARSIAQRPATEQARTSPDGITRTQNRRSYPDILSERPPGIRPVLSLF